MKSALFLLPFFLTLTAFAQSRQEFFDHRFKPSKNAAFYYVITEKQDSLWHRKAYYISHKSLAVEGWYKDEGGKQPHGKYTAYHPTKFQKSEGMYVNGKKEGVWLEWDEKGALIDSSTYKEDRMIGINIRWHSNGMSKDSLHFDSEGNGIQVSWYDDGHVLSTGRWAGDKKKGRWNYFDNNGTVMATEDYTDGKQTACACYDEAGQALDTTLCKEQEAVPAGGLQGWRRFLERNLMSIIQSKSKVVPSGIYSVVIRFIVEKDGSLSDFVALTAYGQGLEEEVIKLLKKAPRWTAGRQFGRPVRLYHTQPVTFQIQQN